MARTYSLDAAEGLLVLSGTITADETVLINLRVYTFKATPGETANAVQLGAAGAKLASRDNLLVAINEGPQGGGAASADVFGYAVLEGGEPAIRVVAKTPGSVGNLIATTETGTNMAWDAATLADGAGNISAWVENILALNQVNSEVSYELQRLQAD